MAEQLRRALQIFASTLTETQALEVAAVYPAWGDGQELRRWGRSSGMGRTRWGDPQALQGYPGPHLPGGLDAGRLRLPL